MDPITKALYDTYLQITGSTPVTPTTSAPQQLQEAHCSTCGKSVPDSEDVEMSEVKKLEKADSEDLKEYPGAKGEAKHNALHAKLAQFLTKMKAMHEAKDGDYAGAPKEEPMSDEELEAYHKDYTKNKGKKKSC
jgi:hypothetical protein